MTAPRRHLFAVSIAAALITLSGSRAVRAQVPGSPGAFGETEEVPLAGRYRLPQRFAVEVRFGPYRPDVDSEFVGANGQQLRTPYQNYFGSGSHLMSQLELDYQLFHRFGSAAVGASVGYFQVSGTSPLANGLPSGDKSTLKVVPVSLLAIYRFDYFLEHRGVPLVPFVKLGLNWAYWQNTNGNGEIATSDSGGTARGGTFGWEAAAGLALTLDIFDPDAAREFDSELGVNHTAILIQFVHADISGLGQSGRLHVGDNTWSAGVLVEF